MCNNQPPHRGPGARRPRTSHSTALMIVVFLLSGCTPVALTALSVGGSAGIQHTMNGISYRTFTAPMPEVRAAAQTALDRMGATNIVLHKSEEGEVLRKGRRSHYRGRPHHDYAEGDADAHHGA